MNQSWTISLNGIGWQIEEIPFDFSQFDCAKVVKAINESWDKDWNLFSLIADDMRNKKLLEEKNKEIQLLKKEIESINKYNVKWDKILGIIEWPRPPFNVGDIIYSQKYDVMCIVTHVNNTGNGEYRPHQYRLSYIAGICDWCSIHAGSVVEENFRLVYRDENMRGK